VIVLLSDGEDHGSILADGRAASLLRIADSGAEVQAFALGAEADTSFLAEAAGTSGGALAAVADDASLNDLFSRLGTRLAGGLTVAVEVPPLAPGEHRLEIRARVDGEPVASTGLVSVTNDGLLTARMRAAGVADSDMLVLELLTVAPPDTLVVHAQARDVALPVLDRPLRVLVDPWRFAPGALDVRVTVMAGDTVVSTATFVAEVPALAPEIHLSMRTAGDVAEAVISGRAQGPGDATLVARVDGADVARGPVPELRVSAVHGQRIVAALEDASGRVLTTTAQPLAGDAAVQTETAASARWSLAAAALAALIGVSLGTKTWAGRRASRRRQWEPSARTLLIGRTAATRVSDSEHLGTLLVLTPHGTERRYPVTRKPLSVGRASDCDVVIEDPAVSPVHARVRALGDGEFQVHGIAPRRQLPFAGRRQDEWMVVRQGEQIAIGTHVLTLLAPAEAAHG
jgi:hypothetical protein